MSTFQEFSETNRSKNWSDIISHAFDLYKGIFLYGILAMIIYFGVSMAMQPVTGFSSQTLSDEIISADGDFGDIDVWSVPGFRLYYGLSGILSLLLAPLYVGILYLANRYHYNQPLRVNDLFIGYRQNFVNIVIYTLISTVIMAISFALCFLPAFFVMPLFLLGYPILLFENASFTDAISKSFKIAKDNYGTFLLVSFIGFLISIAGILLCGIGVIASFPFYMTVMYAAYCAFCGAPRQLGLNA